MLRDEMLQSQQPGVNLQVAGHGQIQGAPREEQTETGPVRILPMIAALKRGSHRTIDDSKAFFEVHILNFRVGLGAAPAKFILLHPEEAP